MPSEWSHQGLFHFTVNATNFERSLEFYQKLGFQLLRDNRDIVWPATVAENFGMVPIPSICPLDSTCAPPTKNCPPAASSSSGRRGRLIRRRASNRSCAAGIPTVWWSS